MSRIGCVVVVAAAMLAGCTTTVTIEDGAWTADCLNVPLGDCEGVAKAFVGGLGGRPDVYQQATGGMIKVSVAASCPAPPSGSSAQGCWRANAPIQGSRACMIIARWVDSVSGDVQFAHVGGDILSGSVAAPKPGSTPC